MLNSKRAVNLLALLLVLAGGFMVAWWALTERPDEESSILSLPEATATIVERLVPTLPPTPPTPLPWTPRPRSTSRPTATSLPSPSSTPSVTWTASPTSDNRMLITMPMESSTVSSAPVTPMPSATTSSTPVPSDTPVPPPPSSGNRWRFGAVNRLGGLDNYDIAALNAGWFVTGTGGARVPPGTGLVLGIWVNGDNFAPDAATLTQLAAANPGTTWQVGNEPDVIWQANCTPEQYAWVYHQVYTALKAGDPGARVAAGVVAQPTPLRLQYLDRVLAAYQSLTGGPMPVDIWAVHNSILREERGSWGVDIPPGIGVDTGMLYEIEDNDRLDIFQAQVVAFRVWMRDRGYQDRPLYLSEFSILMPAEYGFPSERVAAFMTGAFDYLLSAADSNLGYPGDGHRLVQRWAWYSVADTGEDGHYPTGNLFDPVTKEITAVGRAFAGYVATH